MSFFTILGVVTAISLGLIALLAAFAWLQWKRLQKQIRDFGAPLPPTYVVTLHEAKDEELLKAWHDDDRLEASRQELEKLGFRGGVLYTIEEMPGVMLQPFEHPDGPFGALYRQEALGVWVDLCANVEGMEITIGNGLEVAGELEDPPGSHKLMLEGKPVAELWEKLQEACAGRSPIPVPLDRFKQTFEEAYARDMAWRVRKGLTNRAEFERVGADLLENQSETEIEAAFEENQLNEIRQASEAAIQHHRKQVQLSGDQWELYDESAFFVSDQFPRRPCERFILEQFVLEDETQADRLLEDPEAPPDLHGWIRWAITELPEAGVELVEFGSCDWPIEGVVYALRDI